MMHSLVKPIILSLAFALSVAGTSASAQDALKLEGAAHLMSEEVDEQGNVVTTLTEPVVVVPGDRILFTTTYENVSGSPVTDFVITNPVPASVLFASDTGSDLIVSVDGGASWGVLGELEMPDGAGSTRPAVPSDVTHLRWMIAEIAPNDVGQVQYIASVR